MPGESASPRLPATVGGVSWPRGPARPRLQAGAIHVWRADLSGVSDDLLALLSVEERARGARIMSDRRRTLWMRSHGVLRALLGRYLQIDPRAIRFTVGAHGKPALHAAHRGASTNSGAIGQAPLHFNMSHSGPVALYAFSACAQVGVDIEVARRTSYHVPIAARFLGQTERRRAQQLGPAIAQREFLWAWCQHEAVLKLRGNGPMHRAARTGGDAGGDERRVVPLDVGSGATAAVAVLCAPLTMRCWRWV